MSRVQPDKGAAWDGRPTLPYLGEYAITNAGRVNTPMRLPDDHIRWSIADQAWAVDEGFFVARSRYLNRPVIYLLNARKPRHPRWHFMDVANPQAVITIIEREAFWLREGYARLVDFIKQQDQYGYIGAWEPQIEQFSPELRWYKHFLAEQADRRSKFDAQRRIALRLLKDRAKRPPKPVALGPLPKLAQRLVDRRNEEAARLAREIEHKREYDALRAKLKASLEPYPQPKPLKPAKPKVKTPFQQLNEDCARLVAERRKRLGW